ncbi:hypothetical protein T265_04663 [Opisthorchis viverrini]|uniref:UBX domain-containing protein n=1 Tax=Opisthorchis viverrini TaxID=6198 RepID=A0A074ZN25_OPIVI|nr:hypothetical protein T265_04663 [Opisthorchis viverrini]KER28526.1 hypothetical protein T265_04663 [Opisthorchis viverrini]
MPTLVVQYPTGHKASIDVPLNKPLIKALEIACARRSLDPSKHIFIHNRRPVDLTVTFRYSGLVNNAAVDLILDEDKRTTQTDLAAEIRLCFRLDSGQRVLWSGRPSLPLWSILTELASNSAEIKNLISEEGKEAVGPLGVIFLQEQIIGRMNLEATNPAELGILRGSALLQLQQFPPGHPIPSTPAAPISGVAKTTEPFETHSDGGDVINPTEIALETLPPDSNDQDCMEHVTVPFRKPEGTSDVHFETEFVSPYSVFAERPTQSVFGQPEGCDVDHQTQKEPETLGDLLGISLEPGMESMGAASQSESNVQFDQFKPVIERAASLIQLYVLMFELLDLSRSDIGQACLSHSRLQYFFSSDDDMYSVNLNVDRECIAFRLAPITQTTSTEDVPDEFFELTEADLRNILQAYRNEWASNQPLQTAAMRKSAREQLYRKYPRAIIQFHWSDGVVLQACFHPREHVSELYHFIQENMRYPQTELQLYTTPPKTFLKNKDETLIEANLVPMTKVYISPQSLKAEEARPTFLYQAVPPPLVACTLTIPKFKLCCRMQPLTSQSATQSQTGSTTSTRAPVTSNANSETCSLQPKWLKLGTANRSALDDSPVPVD